MARIDIQDDKDKTPASIDELEEQLDKEEPVDAPPHPRESGNIAPKAETPDADPISDAELEAAVSAADETNDPEDQRPLDDQSLHIEANPDAPKVHFWKRKKFWLILLAVVIIALAFAWFIRPSRLFIANTLGLRATLTVTTTTVPEAGQSPSTLKNVAIEAAGEKAATDDKGAATIKVHYGDVTLTAKKPGYADVAQARTIDFDPFFYMLGGRQQDQAARTYDLQLQAVGVPLTFQAKDWLTDTPLTSGTFSVGDIVAKPNDQGIVSLTLPATDEKTIQVKAMFGGTHNDKTLDAKLDGGLQTFAFVPAGREYFVSGRSGGLAVYGSDLDGSNLSEVVPTNANETSAMAIAVSPSGKYLVLASTREAKRDAQNNLLQQLYVVDPATKKLTSVDQALWFNFVDWSNDTLVYEAGEIQPKASEANYRLASINTTNNKQTTLGTATYYTVVRVALGNAAYLVGYGQNQEGYANSPELRVVPIAGGTEKNLGYKVQQIAQSDLDRLAYKTSDGAWHEYNINNTQSKNTAAPGSTNRAFMATPSSDGQSRVVVDVIDGKPTLVTKSVANGQEKQLFAHANLRGPIRIVGNVVIFGLGNADYAIPLTGGNAKKIMDVTAPIAPIPRPNGYFVFF